MNKIVFLGGGNMCEALVSGLYRQHSIVVVEPKTERQEYLSAQYGVQSTGSLSDVQLSADDVLLIAVKPQDVQNALRDIHIDGALVLSIVAGLPCAVLSRYLGGHTRIIRVMPNTPAQIGLGMAGLFAAQNLSADDRITAQTVMQSVGQVVWVKDEEQMHAITAISGSGPGYVFDWMNALFEAAKNQGFDDVQSRMLVNQTVLGAAQLACQSNLPLAQLRQNVTSKGGTTFAALQTFEAGHLAQTIAQGVQACAHRSRQMAAELEQQC